MINLKNLNEHALLRVGILVAIILAAIVLLTSCQKESSFTRGEPRIESDHDLMPPGGYYTEKRIETEALQMASKKANPGKGKGKPGGDTTGTDNPIDPQPPTYTGQGVILLDFDGYDYTGSYWAGPRHFTYSGMTEAEIKTTLDSSQADYAEFGVTVTADESVYNAAPANKRIRVVITEDYEWYGRAGGVAYLNSFTWGNETPAFVFSSLLGYSAKNVWEAASHEAGHTLGLRHQAKWVDGVKVSDYHDGEGLPYAPIMGVGYYKWATWHIGLNSYGQIQDDRAIIKATLNL